jgi:hypothetical protein
MKKEEYENISERIELAKRMLKLNMDIAVIADCTELKQEEIVELKSNIKNC